MECRCKIKRISEVQERVSRAFNSFNLQSVLFEYPKDGELMATASGKMIDILTKYSEGDDVNISILVTSKEGKENRWYHDVRLIAIKLV